MGKMI